MNLCKDFEDCSVLLTSSQKLYKRNGAKVRRIRKEENDFHIKGNKNHRVCPDKRRHAVHGMADRCVGPHTIHAAQADVPHGAILQCRIGSFFFTPGVKKIRT